jgi:hypothetical protein
VTSDWTKVNNDAVCVITFDEISRKGHVEFNDTPGETSTMLKVHAQPNDQVQQNENKPVYVRSNEDGYQIVVDTVGDA